MRPSHEYLYEPSLKKLEDLQYCIEERIRDQAGSIDHLNFITPGDNEADQNSIVTLEPGLSARRGRTLRLSAIIDLDSKISIGCAGAVLMYLQRRKAARCLPREGNIVHAFSISDIEFFSLNEAMYENR